MRSFGDRFEHNLHALRVVETFENPYPGFPGLNLTFEVREGIVKHSSDSVPDEYLPDLRPPLEAQLIDLCDEIAYNTSDLDDGYLAGLISIEEVRGEVDKFRELDEIVIRHFPGVPERVRMHEIVRGLINWLVSGLMEGTIEASAGLADVDQVRNHPRRVARFSTETAAGSAQLKSFLRANLYNSESLKTSRQNSAMRIAAIFEFFLAHPDRLPVNYLEESAGRPLHRLVCDYIAGMTDGFLMRTCAQLGI